MNTLKIPENAAKNTHNVVESLLLQGKSSGKTLDIPCGSGAFSYRLLNRGESVVSADIENILKFEHKGFVSADMNQVLPFKDNEFDTIVSIDGIEHLENPFFFVRECYRTLKSNGNVIISTPNISSMRSRWRWFMTGHHNKCKSPLNEFYPTPLHHITMISYPQLRYMLHTSGFEIETVTTNRIKLPSWIYILYYPFSYVKTWLVYNKEEKEEHQRKTNRLILKAMFSKPIYFGETMIIKARKKQ